MAASGISKAKGRRSAKSKRIGPQSIVAKAGKRKTYGPVVKNAKGVVVSGVRKNTSYEGGTGYTMPDRAETKVQTYAPVGKVLKERLAKVDQLERNSSKASDSDPFIFARMRAHVTSGIYNPLA